MSASALLLAGTGVSAFGQYQQGQAADAQARAEQKWHSYNAEIARRSAIEAEQKALADAQRQRREARDQMSRMRAAYGASGVVMTEGSPLLQIERAAREAEMDVLNILRAGQIEAGQYRSQAVLDTMRGQTARLRGLNAKVSSRWLAGSTLLTGAGYTFQENPRFGANLWNRVWGP